MTIRLLLAEDDPADARLLREALAGEGGAFAIRHVTRLDAALAAIDQGDVDIALVDLSLPDETGLATAERIHAAAPELPLVILTGLDSDEVAMRALHAGAQDYLVKQDVTPQVLSRAIRLAIERKRIEAERRRIERMKDEFVAVVSHELRTPLTSIRGALALLAGGAFGRLPAKGQALLEMALRSTGRLARLVDEILDLERLQSVASPMRLQPLHAAEVILEAVHLMAPQAEQAGIRLSYTPLDAHVLGDADRLIRMLTNLIGNAIKFSTRGSAVRVTGSRNADQVILRVEDHGRGIPADKLEAIFERFAQVDASDAREKGGTGLGLAICRAIADQHGGRIWAESRPGAGSVFHVALPGAMPPPDASPEDTLLAAPHPVQPGPRRRLLVVDDNEDVRELTRVSLESTAGWDVLTAASGADALAKAAGERPDAILLDVMMPDMDGPTALDHLRSLPETRHIPVILLTAKVTPGERDKFAHLGVADILAKPFDPLNLWVQVSRALGWT